MLFDEVRMHLAIWRVGDGPTDQTLAAMQNRMLGENRIPDGNRMLDDGPKGGYR